MKTKIYLSAFSILPFFLSAQEKVIDTVFIFDRHITEAKKTQQVYQISNTDIQKNATNLSEALRFQTPIYIKENGRGSVSSPSFRGTTAQQTSFLWNGIPVNSTFLGQGDINNLSFLNYDNIEVKAGGGSVIYGSAAIGGTIHLNNQISFDKGFQGRFFAEYGSFETLNSSFKTSYSNENFAAVFSAGISQSENDYEVPEKNYINRNGQYNNQTFNLSTAYKFDKDNQIFWHTQHFFGEQHYPVFEVQQTKTKYLSDTFRSLMTWKNSGKKHRNQLSAAYLQEAFSYFPNISKPRESGGNGKNLFFKNDFEYLLNEKFTVNLLAQATNERAEGYKSGIQNPERWAGSAAALLKFSSKKLFLEAGLKKELVEKTEAPFLYSAGGNFKIVPSFNIKFKASKNFRYPSFNDLYWQPGGNPELLPETSYQAELTPEFSWKFFKISVTPYYNKIEHMIRWLPASGGIWKPVNTDEVRSYGLEAVLGFNKSFSKHQILGNIGYAYTKSENAETGFQLSYVPLHKAFGMLQYRFQPFEIFVQGMFNGQTFTTTDESIADALQPYFVLNTGISATLFRNYKIGFKVNNLSNTVYETMSYYPLPKRNYSLNLSINF